jgi:hypothetical protein
MGPREVAGQGSATGLGVAAKIDEMAEPSEVTRSSETAGPDRDGLTAAIRYNWAAEPSEAARPKSRWI